MITPSWRAATATRGLAAAVDETQQSGRGADNDPALSMTHEAVGFERRMREIDFDELGHPGTVTLPIAAERVEGHEGSPPPAIPLSDVEPERETIMRPQNAIDWIAFVFVLIGAFSWAYFVTDTNILDKALEPIADILDDIVFVLIGLSGLWWLYRVITPERRS